MAKSYVKFEVSKELAAKTYEALQMARQSGKIRKGINEVTKSIERGAATLVVLAEDIEPEEIAMHIPSLCDQKKIAYTYVPSKLELGKSIGLNVQCAAIAVESQGNAQQAIKDIVSRATGTSQKPASKEQHAEQHHHEEHESAQAQKSAKAEAEKQGHKEEKAEAPGSNSEN